MDTPGPNFPLLVLLARLSGLAHSILHSTASVWLLALGLVMLSTGAASVWGLRRRSRCTVGTSGSASGTWSIATGTISRRSNTTSSVTAPGIPGQSCGWPTGTATRRTSRGVRLGSQAQTRWKV